MRGRFLLLSILLIPSILYSQRVRLGAEVLLAKRLDLVEGKRVGLICNHTSVLPNKTHLVDTLLARNVRIAALFSPEHGIRGIKPRGMKVEDAIDEKTGLKIYSLYGTRQKPTPEMLENIDVLIFDIQDVGARFFTYYITMSYAMEASAKNGKIFIVLDRPNPINGTDLEGPILDSLLQSGVGRFPLPTRHGLTIGELAKMILGEGWLGERSNLSLIVIPMEGWRRDMWYDQTKLPWLPPSPNIKSLSTATVYPGTCLFEATNLSEGRGTFKPFEYLGAPWLDRFVTTKLNALHLPGARFHPIVFTPNADSVRAPNPKYKNEQCSGIFIQVTNRNTFRPVTAALKIIETLITSYPSQFTFDSTFFDKLLGSGQFRQSLGEQPAADSLISFWSDKLEDFRQKRLRYLLY